MADPPDQSDLYRRIDELLSKPTDEQVREQRALNDLMVGVRDAIARLTGDVAALAARVSETREYAERLADRPIPTPPPPPPAAPVGPAEMPPDLVERLDGLETAIGQLAAAVSSGLAATAEAPDLTPLVHITVPEAIRGAVPSALRDVIPEAIREAVPQAVRDAIPEAVRGAVEGQLGRFAEAASEGRAEVSNTITDEVAGLRGSLVSALESTRDEMRRSSEELRELIGTSGAEARESLARSVLELRNGIAAAATAGLTAVDVQALLDRASSELASRLDDARGRGDALGATISAIEQRLDERFGTVDGRLGTMDVISGDIASVRKALRDSLEAVTTDLSAMRQALAGTSDLAARVERAITEGRVSIQEAIDAIAAQIRDDASSVAERIRSEAGLVLEKTTSLAQSATERLGEASTLALARIGTTGSTSFDRLQDAATAVEREMAKVPKAVREISSRMDEFQETMLAYLTARDLALEETRDRVLQELLDEYATGLSQRQRAALGTGLRRAFARRRDKRDAARYRSAPAAQEAPSLPQIERSSLDRAATELSERAGAAEMKEMEAPPPAAVEPQRPAEAPVPIAPAVPSIPPTAMPEPRVRSTPTPRKAPAKAKPAAPKSTPVAPKTAAPKMTTPQAVVRQAKPAETPEPGPVAVKPGPVTVKPGAVAMKPVPVKPVPVKRAIDAPKPAPAKPDVGAPTAAPVGAEPVSSASPEPEKPTAPSTAAGLAPQERAAKEMKLVSSELREIPGQGWEKLTESRPVAPAPAGPTPLPSRPKLTRPSATLKRPTAGAARPTPQSTAKVAAAKPPRSKVQPPKAEPSKTEPPKSEAPRPKAARKTSRGGGSEGSLAARLSADAKRTADRLAAEARERDEAAKRARAEEAASVKDEDD